MDRRCRRIGRILPTAALTAASLVGAGWLTVAQAAIQINLNGQPISTSVAPITYNNRTLVPMRDIFEALGATLQWHPVTQNVTAQKDLTNITLQMGSSTAIINGRRVGLDQAPLIIAGRTMVPLRFVAEALNAKVDWNGAAQLVDITTPGGGSTYPGATLAENGGTYTGSGYETVAPARTENIPQPAVSGEAATGDTYTDRNRERDRDRNRDRNWRDRRERRESVAGVRTISVPEGAVVPVTLDQALSSATAVVGQTFTGSVASMRLGDSEFPVGSKLEGLIVEARPKNGDNPGVLDLDFRTVVLPDGKRYPLRGELIELDNNSVGMAQGRIVAKTGSRSSTGDKLKIIGIGAAGGYLLGRILDTNKTVTTAAGAIGGYIYSRSRDKKAAEAVLQRGARLGVRLNDSLAYADTTNYGEYRTQFLRVQANETGNYVDAGTPATYPGTASTTPASTYPSDPYNDGSYTDGTYGNSTENYSTGADVNAGSATYPTVTYPPATDVYPATGSQVANARTISVPAGAVVPVTLDQQLTSGTTRVGQTFTTSVVSQRIGDSEFPVGSRLEGVVLESRAKNGDNPGVLDLDFRTVVLPDGTRVPLRGELISLDDKSVTTSQGRIMAKQGGSKSTGDKLKIVGIGAGAGFLLGKVLGTNTTLTTILGAVGGYLYGQSKDQKAAEANLARGTKLAVRLNDNVTYADSNGYAQYRVAYLRQ